MAKKDWEARRSERWDGGSAADRRKRDRAGGKTPAERFNWDVQRVLDWAKRNGLAESMLIGKGTLVSFWVEDPPIQRDHKPKVWAAAAILTAMEHLALCDVLEDWT